LIYYFAKKIPTQHNEQQLLFARGRYKSANSLL